jgi:hypothetical protein
MPWPWPPPLFQGKKHASRALAARPQRARARSRPIPGTGVPPPACCPAPVTQKIISSAGCSGAFHTAPTKFPPQCAQICIEGSYPSTRVIQEGVRGRTASGYRPNGRCRGRGRRASGVDTSGEAPGWSRLRWRVRPRHPLPPPACTAWGPCCGGQVALRFLVMGRARTRYSGDLGKSRQSLRPTAWPTHRNAPHGGVDFYPLLAKSR